MAFVTDPKNRALVAAALVGGVAAVSALHEPEAEELAWKDFVQLYLAPRKVEKLVVVNKSAVRVVVKGTGSGAHASAPDVFLTIGSVDNFERKLECVWRRHSSPARGPSTHALTPPIVLSFPPAAIFRPPLPTGKRSTRCRSRPTRWCP